MVNVWKSSSKMAFFGCCAGLPKIPHTRLNLLKVLGSCFTFNYHSEDNFAIHPLLRISMPEINLDLEFLIKNLTSYKIKVRPIRADKKLSFSQESKNTDYKTGYFQWRILFDHLY